MCGVLCLQLFFFAIGYSMFYPLKKVAFTWEISHVTNVHSPRATELRRRLCFFFQDEATLTGAAVILMLFAK